MIPLPIPAATLQADWRTLLGINLFLRRSGGRGWGGGGGGGGGASELYNTHNEHYPRPMAAPPSGRAKQCNVKPALMVFPSSAAPS